MPPPKKKKKKKQNTKKKPQRKYHSKQNKSSLHKQQTNKQQGKIKIGCEGTIFLPKIGNDGRDVYMPFWAKMSGHIISLYEDKNNMNIVPYDIIDTTPFVDVMSTPNMHTDGKYVLVLLNEKQGHGSKILNFANANKLFFCFSKEHDMRKWLQSFRNITRLNQKRKVITSHINTSSLDNIIYHGSVVIDTKVRFVELTCDGKLIVYDNNLSNRTQMRTIELSKCNNISSIKSKPTDSLLKYRLVLNLQIDDNSNHDLCIAFKKNNNRHELLAHIDFFINNTSLHEMKQDQKSQIIETNSKNALKIMQSALKIYEQWKNKKDKVESLQICLRKELNSNYLNILHCLHCIIVNEQMSNVMHCDRRNECQYLNRHRLRNKRFSSNQDENNDGNRNRNHIALAELLDKAHVYLCHSDKKMSIRENISNKFVIDTTNDDSKNAQDDDIKHDENDDNKNDENDSIIFGLTTGVSKLFQRVVTAMGASLYSDDSLTVEADEKQVKQPNSEPSMFAFGASFDYYQERLGNYIEPYYSCLKQELIFNPYCKLDVNKYYAIYEHALQIQKSIQFKSMKAQHAGIWNDATGIYINDPLTVNHIISLLIYCNETEIQRIFKKHTRRSNNRESLSNVFRRQSFIAHWTRYLTEACLFYGAPLSKDVNIYCGVDKKVIFDSMSFSNYCPLSTSSDVVVANNFATNQGLIMKLQSNTSQSGNCMSFNMTLLSDYPAEKEIFLCGSAKLKFVDIIIEGNSNKDKVSALRLLEAILNGNLFYYEWNKDVYAIQTQMVAIELLEDYINDIRKDYFSQLASALINSFITSDQSSIALGEKFLCLNSVEISKLDDRLRKYVDISATPLLFVSKKWDETINALNNKNLRLNLSVVYQTKIKGNELNRLRQINIGIGQLKIGDCVVGKYCFEFYFTKCCQDKKQYYEICIVLKSRIMYSLKISWDMVCKEVKHENTQSLFRLGYGNYRGHSSVFSCSEIKKIRCLSVDLNIRVLCIFQN